MYKQVFLLSISVLFSSSVFSYTVVDYMFEHELTVSRVPASNDNQYCLKDISDRKFANSCYTTIDLCNKRLEFWQDLPGNHPYKCSKAY